jgi:hypothetical protein
MQLRIRQIEKAQDFRALAPVWAQLAKAHGHLSPFLSYDWFWCCWHGVWPQRRPEILLVEDVGGPIGVVPLMHWRGWVRGLPVRYVGFLECHITPWVDLLTVGEHDSVVEAFLDHLTSRSDWDVAWLQKLPATSRTLNALEKLLPDRLPWCLAGRQFSPYVAIDGNWERFVEVKSRFCPEFPQWIEAHLKHVSDVDLEEHRAENLQTPFVQEVLQVMHRSSQSKDGMGTTPMSRTLEFFRELTRRASKNGWLSLWSVRLNDHIVGIEYQLRSDGIAQALSSWAYPTSRGVLTGSALNVAILKSLFGSGGVHEYIMGAGFEGDLPLLATACHDTVHVKLYRPGIYSSLLHELETIVGLKTP